MAARLLSPPRGHDFLGWAMVAAIVGIYVGLDWLSRRAYA